MPCSRVFLIEADPPCPPESQGIYGQLKVWDELNDDRCGWHVARSSA